MKSFSGDVNALPYRGKRQPYSLLTSIMTDSLVDKYPDASWHPWFATFGNKYNTYSSDFTPERIDYLMYWASPEVAMCTRNFTMPMYTTQNGEGEVVSLSDHEALSAEFLIEKRNSDKPVIMATIAKNQRNRRLLYWNDNQIEKRNSDKPVIMATIAKNQRNRRLLYWNDNQRT